MLDDSQVLGGGIMLRITPLETNRCAVILRVEGRVIGRWAEALKLTCDRILTSGATLTLDLSGVSFIERGAVELFRNLRERQVNLLNCSIFVEEQLKAQEPDNDADADGTEAGGRAGRIAG